VGYVTEAYNLDSLEVDVKGFLMMYDMCYISEPHMWLIVVRNGIFHHMRDQIRFFFLLSILCRIIHIYSYVVVYNEIWLATNDMWYI